MFLSLPFLDPEEDNNRMSSSSIPVDPSFGQSDQFVFNVQWFDPTTDADRKFLLTFYPRDNSVEMVKERHNTYQYNDLITLLSFKYDLKLRRIFLSRIHCDSVHLSDLFLGNTVIVFSRRLLIKGNANVDVEIGPTLTCVLCADYANEATKNRIEPNHEATFAMVKPDGIANLGNIISVIEDSGFSIGRAMMTELSKEQAEEFYEEHRGRDFFE